GGGQPPPITVNTLAGIEAEKTTRKPMQGGIGCPHRLLTRLFGGHNQGRQTGEVVLPSERLPLLP
ncbi:MAG: hypothetical protein ACE5HN_10270, partial [Nitrospiria bacterium]